MNINNHLHAFSLGSMQVVLQIDRIDGMWSCKIIEGYTGIGTCTGGTYSTLEKYIEHMEGEHRYCYSNIVAVIKNPSNLTTGGIT